MSDQKRDPYNYCRLRGTVTQQDAEVKHTGGGTPYAKFGIAVPRNYKPKDGERAVDYFDVICWRDAAEAAGTVCKHKARVVIEGEVQNSEWTDRTGAKRKSVQILAYSVAPFGAAQDGEERSPAGRDAAAQTSDAAPDISDPFADQ